jgi:hypothetical protein
VAVEDQPMNVPPYLRLAALCLLCAPALHAQPLPVGPGRRLNSLTAGEQSLPAAAAGYQGNTIVVWQTTEPEGCRVIAGQRLQAGGELLGFEGELSDTAVCDGGPNALEPRVAVNPMAPGNFVAAWGLEPGLFPSPRREIRVRNFSFPFGPFGSSSLVDDDHGAGFLAPGSVTFHPTNGRFAVAWNAYFIGTTNPVTNLLGRTYDATGGPLGRPYGLGTGEGAAVWTTAGLLAAWREGAPILNVPFRIVLRRFNAAGAPLSPVVEVSAAGAPDALALASNGTGDSLLVWTADDGGGRGTFARLYDAAGNPRTTAFRVSTQTIGPAASTAVASDGTSFLVAWDDDGDPPLVRARLIAANGTPVGAPFRVDPFATTAQKTPAVAAGPPGSFHVAWQGFWPGAVSGDDRDILYQRLAIVAGLANGVAITGLADDVVGNVRYFSLEVPADAASLEVQTTGGSGDADLMVSHGELPTAERHDFSSAHVGNDELLLIDSPQAGTWYVGVQTAAPFSGVALSATATLAPTSCVADGETLCLDQGRFAVTAAWRTGAGSTGPGQAVTMTADTGHFWFFDSANVEAVIKVLNGCGVNGRYWVFAGGLTDVAVSLTVVDTRTGAFRTYTNPQGISFQPIQDTAAFPTCP